MIGNCVDKTNFPHELFLTTRQVANICKTFGNNSSTDTKLSKAQLSKLIQEVGFLSRLLGRLLKTGLPLIKNVIKPLTKSILIPLGLTAAASAADAATHKKILGSGHNTTTLIISNGEMEDIIKIVKSLEGSRLLLKAVSKTIQNEIKEQKGGFISMLLGTLGAILLGNILGGKEKNGAGYGNKKRKGIIKAGYGFLIPLRPLTNFEMQKYYRNEPRFNGVYSRDNLQNKIKDGAYTINLDKRSDIGTH